MTIAEALQAAIEANPDGDKWDIMEEVSKSLYDQCRTMNDHGDVMVFEDGSFYSFDQNITDEDANPCFSTRADLMTGIDAYNSVLDYTDNRCPVTEYSGVVHDSGDRIDTLELMDIVDASGKRVRITAREGSYVADGCSPKGVPFSFNEPVLLDVTLLGVMPDTPELRTMEVAGKV